MPADEKLAESIKVDEGQPKSQPPQLDRARDTLDRHVPLVLGMMRFTDANGTHHTCQFQFNPTELERSRTVNFTRTLTGNTLEEPGGGARNQPKRKATRKPDPWAMSLTLRFDAGFYVHSDKPLNAGSFKHKIDSVKQAMKFFEALVEPGPYERENEKTGNADETPPPPFVCFTYGTRIWQCAVKTLRIKEEDYTYDLYPRRFEVTLSVEAVETVVQANNGDTGATP